ncbi:MAG: hypothetical protein INR71_00635 [Terriglobus roseus]|nr:hypothetical protein [Terriglobus roseus]
MMPENGAPRTSYTPQLNNHASFQSTSTDATIANRRISTVSSAPSSLHPGSVGPQSRRVSNGSVFSVAPSMHSIASDYTAYTDVSNAAQVNGPQMVHTVAFGSPQTLVPGAQVQSMHASQFHSFEWPAATPASMQQNGMHPQPPSVQSSSSVTPVGKAAKKGSVTSVKQENGETASPKTGKGDDAPKVQKYVCTSCETKFIRKSDWKQHEERLHERTSQWQCPDCNLDQLWSRNQFKQHHKQAHGCENCPHADQAVIPLRKRTAWGCGFCAQLHQDWEERCQHVAQHYDKGQTKSDWKHSNVIWALLHQVDIHPVWRQYLGEKHGARPDPKPLLAWDRKASGRSHEVNQEGQHTRLQDMLEFGGEPRDSLAIVQKAYELGIKNPPGQARPESASLESQFRVDGQVLASPSPTTTGFRDSQLAPATMSSSASIQSAPELSRRASTAASTMSSPVPKTGTHSPSSGLGQVDASPMSIVSPIQQLTGQLSVSDVSSPSQMAPSHLQPSMQPAMFTGGPNSSMPPPGPAWTPQEASNFLQMHYSTEQQQHQVNGGAEEKALPPLPGNHFDVPLMPSSNRFSDDSALTGILFAGLDDDGAFGVDSLHDQLSFSFQPTDENMVDHLQ